MTTKAIKAATKVVSKVRDLASIATKKMLAVKAKEAGFYIETPLFSNNSSATQWGMDIKYKMDNFQPSGSFKDRGIGNMITSLIETTDISRLICSSGGNAGYSVATIGEKVGLPTDVYIPVTVLPMMIKKLKEKKAIVHIGGANWNEADILAREALAKDPSAYYIPPFDDKLIWDGHASIVDELKTSLGEFGRPDVIVLSVGGGGLLAGIQRGLDRVGWNDVKIVAVETEGANSFNASKLAGEVVKLDKINTVATSLGCLTITSGVSLDDRTDSLICTDAEAISACLIFADEQRSLVEPACGAALSAVYTERHRNFLMKLNKRGALLRVVVIICGGNIVSLDLLSQWKEKFLN